MIDVLRDAEKACNGNAAEVARRLGISKPHWVDLKRGTRRLSPLLLAAAREIAQGPNRDDEDKDTV